MLSLRVPVSIVLLVPMVASAADRPAGEPDRPFGLERRIAWSDSRVVGSPDPLLPYKVVRAFPGLTVKQPADPDPRAGDRPPVHLSSTSITGPGPAGCSPSATTQDADAEPRRCSRSTGSPYGLAFHPDYERNGYHLHRPERSDEGRAGRRRWCATRSTGGRRIAIDPGSKRLIIEWPSNGHDGGDLAFGNDGTLYVSSGDGSSDSDANLTGQTPRRPAGRRAADRRRSSRAGPELRRAQGQPVRRSPRRPARDLGLRPAQSLAAELRPRSRASSGSATTGRTCGSRST